MGHLDKTRDNIKVQHLEDGDRKELFNKFVKAGGQVVTEKAKKHIKIDREKQKELQRRLDEHNKNIKNYNPQQTYTSSSYDSSSYSSNHDSGFGLFLIRLRLFFGGVVTLNGLNFKNKFLRKIRSEFNPALMDLQTVFLDLFKKNPVIGVQIIEQLDKMRPLYYELIEMSGDIYNISTTSQLIDKFCSNPHGLYSVNNYKIPIIDYYRKMYLLHSYVDIIFFSYENAIELQQRMERGKSSEYSAKKKRIRNSLYIVFNKFFNDFHNLFCLIKSESINSMNTHRLDELLNIKPHMKPGTRQINQPPAKFVSSTEKLSSEKPEPETEKHEPETLEAKPFEYPAEVKKGFSLMDSIDFIQLRKEIVKNDFLINLGESDKVMKTYLFFLEFDREYSFVLTTYKIKYAPAYSIRGKSDYRALLSDIYNQTRPCYDSLREYFESLEVYEKFRVDRPASSSQYYQYTKRLADLEKDKKTKGRNAKIRIQTYMGKIADEMQTLISDMDFMHEIILNPQDIIEFDSPLDSTRKMKDRKIYEAIVSLHSYASAFAYRLSPNGDLYGELSDEEVSKPQKKEIPPTSNANAGILKTAEPQNTPDTKKDQSSILGELDDFL